MSHENVVSDLIELLRMKSKWNLVNPLFGEDGKWWKKVLMKKKMAEKNCSSIEELKSHLKTIWVSDISVELCQSLAMSMPRRIQAVLQNKGYNTKY